MTAQTVVDESVTLFKGDALAVLAELGDGTVDAVVADPPYSSGGFVRSDRVQNTRTKYVQSDAKHDLADFSGDSRDARAYAYWSALWLGEALRVWGSNGSMGMDYSADVLPGFYSASAPRDREHITQKPVDVLRSLVRICPAGGTVLDPFMGAGTTGVAAVLEGRSFIGVELTEHYMAIAERRIREAAGHQVPRGDQASFDFGGAS